MVAVVTGGSRGIGRAITLALLGAGYTVVCTARNENENIAAMKAEYGDRFAFVRADNACAEDRAALVREVRERFGGADMLVNNAGVAPKVRKDMLEIGEEELDYVLGVNLKAPFLLTQAIAADMIKKGGGRIVNISSVSAYTASVDRAEYCIAKAGVAMCTKLYAARLAEHNIGVFEIRPGIIATDMTRAVSDKYARMIEGGLTPIKRMGTPEDVASCVLAIAEGRLDFCTGTTIDADGGFSVRRL